MKSLHTTASAPRARASTAREWRRSGASVTGYAPRLGAKSIAAHEEVETARRDSLRNRPELRAGLAHARRTGATLVIARIDRPARSVLVTAELMASGVDFVACDNPHANRLTIQILAAWPSTNPKHEVHHYFIVVLSLCSQLSLGEVEARPFSSAYRYC